MILGFFECVFPISLPFFPSSCGVNSKFTFVFSLPLTHHFLYSSSVHLCCHGFECSQIIAGLQLLSYVHMSCLGNTVSHTIFVPPSVWMQTIELSTKVLRGQSPTILPTYPCFELVTIHHLLYLCM